MSLALANAKAKLIVSLSPWAQSERALHITTDSGPMNFAKLAQDAPCDGHAPPTHWPICWHKRSEWIPWADRAAPPASTPAEFSVHSSGWVPYWFMCFLYAASIPSPSISHPWVLASSLIFTGSSSNLLLMV